MFLLDDLLAIVLLKMSLKLNSVLNNSRYRVVMRKNIHKMNAYKSQDSEYIKPTVYLTYTSIAEEKYRHVYFC